MQHCEGYALSQGRNLGASAVSHQARRPQPEGINHTTHRDIARPILLK